MNIEKGLLLCSEARVGEILGRCAAAHGYAHSLYEAGRQRCGQNRRSNPSAGCLQSADVGDVDSRKSVSNGALEIAATAVVISFPLAYLFELGGDTIWAPAILHVVIQATVKVLVLSQGAESFALAWMAGCAIVPLLVFTVKAPARR